MRRLFRAPFLYMAFRETADRQSFAKLAAFCNEAETEM
jgi:hypothetical protein